jgi:hypothetical protein
MRDLGIHADRAIYVLIATLAVSVALQDGTGASPVAVLASVAGTAIALTLAELFAGRVGISIREHRTPTDGEMRSEYHAALTGLAVAALPTVFFLLATLDLIKLETAFVIAQWTGFAVIGIYAYIAARSAGRSQARSLVSGVGLALIGGMLILINSLLK